MKKISKRLIVTGLVAIVMIAFLVYFNLVSSEEADQKLPTVEVEKDIVTLRGFTIGNKPVDGMEEFYQQLDALTIPDLGCKVRFDYIPWGDEKNKIDLSIASGQYDLYVGGVFSNYKETALKNAFLDLKPYLELVPDLVSHYTQVSEHSLTLCEINGKLFGIPQFARVEKGADEGFIYREDLRKEWGLPEINSLETMEMYLYAAKSDERYKDKPLLTDNRIYTSLWLILTGHKYRLLDNYYTCYEYDNPTKLLKVHETPEWKEVCQYAKKWYDDGIISYDILVVSGNEGAKGRELMLKDMKPCEANVPYWSATVNWIPILYDKHPEWDIHMEPNVCSL
ncbi:MAG: carbohydrate ABC transporter substrate-binding protein [Clostridiales bacterium]|nr:carbohydrate ABC transporter substrate-binding protein [Clostridiales bacterium]